MRKKNLLRTLFTLVSALFLLPAIQFQAFAGVCPVTGVPISGSITAGDPTQTDRVLRNGVPSDCNGKTYPGNFGSASSFHFDQQSFLNNSGSTVCIQITLNATTNMHSVAYLNSFNPANLSQNYLGDLGVVNTPNTNESYSVSVPNGATLVVVVNEATANGGGNYTLTLACISPPPPLANQPGQILFTELRLSGPGAGGGSQRDEYIELYNNTDQPRTIDRLLLRAYDPNFFGPADGADFIQGFDPGTFIPARGHLLIGDNSAYSLGAYAALNLDTAPLFNGDFFIDNEGIQVITDDAVPVVIDSIGFSGSGGRPGEVVSYAEGTPLSRRTQTAPIVQYAYVRKMVKENFGLPQDTNNNAADFTLISVDGSTFPLAAGGTAQSTLGGPGPENLASPINRNAQFGTGLLDSTVASSASPNRVRNLTPVTNGTFGTMTIRRRVTNNTGGPVTRLRFRIIDITTFPTPNGSTADLRSLTSGDTAVNGVNDTVTCTALGLSTPCNVTALGTTLEQPPNQASGGGLNSSLSLPSVTTGPALIVETSPRGKMKVGKPMPKGVQEVPLQAPLANGSSLIVQFVVGVQQTGTFRFFVTVEALP